MIDELAEFLRYTLTRNRDGSATLGEELDVVRGYLTIE